MTTITEQLEIEEGENKTTAGGTLQDKKLKDLLIYVPFK